MKIRTLLFISLAVLLVASVGCKKSSTQVEKEKTIQDMNVPDGFTFETTHEVSLTIKMPASLDFTDLRSRFDVYSANPADGGKLITSGSFNENGEYSGLIRIPTSLNEVFVSSFVGSAMVSVENSNLKEGGVIIDFGDDYGYYPPDSIGADLKSNIISNNNITYTKQFSSATNLVANGDFSVNDFNHIHRWENNRTIDGKWSFSRDRGPFGYMEWAQNGSDGYIRTHNSNIRFIGGTSQLVDASPGDLLTFTADVKREGVIGITHAWLYLIPLRSNGNAIAFYNIYMSTVPTNWTNKMIAATMPAGTESCLVLMWANDYSILSSVYFDNAVVTGPVTDADNDGVDDDLDDYPNDASRAFDVYYPNETDWGTLVYEDLWPGTGDYDFNDLVLDYQFQSVLSSENKLVEFFTDYSVRAVGASLHNAFGFSLGGDPANVASVTGNNIVHGDLNMNANGTEQGQDNTVLFMFDDAFDMIGSSGSTFINTQTDVAYVEPDTSRVHVLYQNPISASVTGTAPYNPFVVVDLPASRGTEVHLPGNAPTDLADMTLFGQWADDSNPATGKYYQSVTNLPWALDLPVSFEYPVEQVEIINAYNHFVEWAESAGSVYPDWYNDGSGYRNTENIYSPSK
jgi:LruC domain-containing protein